MEDTMMVRRTPLRTAKSRSDLVPNTLVAQMAARDFTEKSYAQWINASTPSSASGEQHSTML
jgi:tRNA U54 and U55 pseudouridine synthase Pus10